MEYYKYYLIANVIICLLERISTGYVYQVVEDKLNQITRIELSLFVKQFLGIIIYGTDSNSKFLLLVENENGEKKLIWKFNKFHAAIRSHDLCGCSICSDLYMQFRIQFGINQITIQCNGHSQFWDFNDTTSSNNSFTDYPPNQDNLHEKVSIYIGNIGTVLYNDKIYYTFKNQMIGCVDSFYFNEKLIPMNQSGTDILNHCSRQYNETICNKGHCKSTWKSYNFTDCSTQALNVRYCKTDLVAYKSQTYIKISANKNPIQIRLDWQPLFFSKVCLAEIKLKNKGSLILYVNQYQEITLQSDGLMKRFIKISRDKVNVLLVQFKNTEIAIKTSNDEKIWTHIIPMNYEVTRIEIGLDQKSKLCEKFAGFINFQYDKSQFMLLVGVPNDNYSGGPILNQMWFIGVGVFLIFLGLSILFWYFLTKEIKTKHTEHPVVEVEPEHHETFECKNIVLVRLSGEYEIIDHCT